MAAINIRAAHTAYHSKYYAKLRKTGNAIPTYKGPQVGRIPTIEELMCDRQFVERVKPAKNSSVYSFNDSNDPPWKALAWLTGLLAFVLLFLEIDAWLVETAILLVWGIMLWVEIKLDGALIGRYVGRLGEYDRSWLCVKCGHQWVASGNR